MDRTVVFLMIVKKCNAGAVCSCGVQQVSSLVMREDTCTFCFFYLKPLVPIESYCGIDNCCILIGNATYISIHIYYISDID